MLVVYSAADLKWVSELNKSLFLARPSLHARYTVRITLQTVNTDGNDGLTKARPYIKPD